MDPTKVQESLSWCIAHQHDEHLYEAEVHKHVSLVVKGIVEQQLGRGDVEPLSVDLLERVWEQWAGTRVPGMDLDSDVVALLTDAHVAYQERHYAPIAGLDLDDDEFYFSARSTSRDTYLPGVEKGGESDRSDSPVTGHLREAAGYLKSLDQGLRLAQEILRNPGYNAAVFKAIGDVGYDLATGAWLRAMLDVGVATWGVMNMYGNAEGKARGRTEGLLKTIEGGCGVIDGLAMENLTRIDECTHLVSLLDRHLDRALEQREELEALASEGIDELADGAAHALVLNQRAQDCYLGARERIARARQQAMLQRDTLQNVVGSLAGAREGLAAAGLDAAENEDVEALAAATREIRENLTVVSAIVTAAIHQADDFGGAGGFLDEALELMGEAAGSHDEATRAWVELKELQEARLGRLREEAHGIELEAMQGQVESVANRLGEMEEIAHAQRQMTARMRSAIEEVRREDAAGYRGRDVIVGGVALMAGMATGGTAAAVVLGVMGLEGSKRGAAITNMAVRRFAPPETDARRCAYASENVIFQFDRHPHGITGVLEGRGSRTYGVLSVRVMPPSADGGGDEWIQLPIAFNFNVDGQTTPLVLTGQSELIQTLADAALNGQISPEEVDQIIDQLTNMRIDRGPDHRAVIGLIHPGEGERRHPAYKLLDLRMDSARVAVEAGTIEPPGVSERYRANEVRCVFEPLEPGYMQYVSPLTVPPVGTLEITIGSERLRVQIADSEEMPLEWAQLANLGGCMRRALLRGRVTSEACCAFLDALQQPNENWGGRVLIQDPAWVPMLVRAMLPDIGYPVDAVYNESVLFESIGEGEDVVAVTPDIDEPIWSNSTGLRKHLHSWSYGLIPAGASRTDGFLQINLGAAAMPVLVHFNLNRDLVISDSDLIVLALALEEAFHAGTSTLVQIETFLNNLIDRRQKRRDGNSVALVTPRQRARCFANIDRLIVGGMEARGRRSSTDAAVATTTSTTGRFEDAGEGPAPVEGRGRSPDPLKEARESGDEGDDLFASANDNGFVDEPPIVDGEGHVDSSRGED